MDEVDEKQVVDDVDDELEDDVEDEDILEFEETDVRRSISGFIGSA